VGRLSRNGSFAVEVGKINTALARGGSLVIDIEAQAQRQHVNSMEMPQSAPARHSLPLQSVPSQGRQSAQQETPTRIAMSLAVIKVYGQYQHKRCPSVSAC